LVERAIIDKNARIGERAVIRNVERVREADRDNFCVRDGIVVVPKNSVIPAGTVI
jgi:glucose-1-phosphate adenylyltransferase